jgi:hypothetical protein
MTQFVGAAIARGTRNPPSGTPGIPVVESTQPTSGAANPKFSPHRRCFAYDGRGRRKYDHNRRIALSCFSSTTSTYPPLTHLFLRDGSPRAVPLLPPRVSRACEGARSSLPADAPIRRRTPPIAGSGARPDTWGRENPLIARVPHGRHNNLRTKPSPLYRRPTDRLGRPSAGRSVTNRSHGFRNARPPFSMLRRRGPACRRSPPVAEGRGPLTRRRSRDRPTRRSGARDHPPTIAVGAEPGSTVR